MIKSFFSPRIVLAAGTVLLAINGRAAIPSAERLLPDDTLVVITAPDFTRVRELYQTSPQTRLWNDPAMKPFKDHFLARLKEELVEPLERDLGVKLDDYTSLPQGQLTFAITRNDWKGPGDGTMGYLLLLDAKEKSSQLQTNLANLRRKWVDSGKLIRTEKIREIEFSIFPVSESDMPKSLGKLFSPKPDGEGWTSEEDEATNENAKAEWVVGQHESLLILANSPRAAEKVAVYLTGGSMPALVDQAAFDEVRLSMFRDVPVYAWVNVKAFFDQMAGRSADQEESPFAFLNPDKILKATGLGSIRSISATLDSNRDGSLFRLFASAPESTRQGLFKVLPSEPKDAAPPAFVPADSVKFQRSRIDAQKAWATLQQMLDDISPSVGEMLKAVVDAANTAAKDKDPDFDIQRNLFRNLGDDLITYEKAPAGTSPAELASPPSLFLISSPQPEQLASALKSVLVFLNQQGSAPAEREFLGRRIYSLPMSPGLGAFAGPNRGPRRTLHFAASGGYVAMTTHASMLEEYLRSSEGQPKPLRERSGLTEAAARTDGMTTGMFGYENQSETARTFFAVLKNSGTNSSPAALPGMGLPGTPNPFRQWMDFSLLPPFERLSKYFSFSVHTLNTTASGVTLKVYAPTPPAEMQRE